MVKGIIILSHVPIALAAVYGYILRDHLDKKLRAFNLFLYVSAVIQVASLLLFLLRINNMPLLHVYVAAGFSCLLFFYRAVLQGFISQRILLWMLVLFLAFTLINSAFVQLPFTYNSYALTVESVLIIILSLFTFMLLLNDSVRESNQRLIKSLNWINSGLFFYYSSSLLIFYFGDLITAFTPSHLVKYTWALHALFSMIMYTCFIVGLWKRPTN